MKQDDQQERERWKVYACLVGGNLPYLAGIVARNRAEVMEGRLTIQGNKSSSGIQKFMVF